MCVCACVKFLQSCPTLCDHMACSPPGSSVNGILQARILEWIAMHSFRWSSWPRDQTHIFYISHIGTRVLYHLVPPGKPTYMSVCVCVCVCVCTHILRKELYFWLESSFLLYNMLRTVIIFTVLCKSIVFHQFISESYRLKECLNVEGEKKEKILILCSLAFPFRIFIHSSNYPHFPGYFLCFL